MPSTVLPKDDEPSNRKRPARGPSAAQFSETSREMTRPRGYATERSSCLHYLQQRITSLLMREPKTLIAFRCERSAAEQLAALAHQGDRSLSAEIRRAVREHEATQEPRPLSAGTDADHADAASAIGVVRNGDAA